MKADPSEKTPLAHPNDGADSATNDLPPLKTEVVKTEDIEILEDIPADKLNVVLMVMMLHGIGTLIAWNSFITIAPTYFRDYKLKTAVSPPYPGYIENFMNYVCICAQLPNLAVNAIGLFIDKGNLYVRIVVSLFIIITSCLFTTIFIFIDTTAWPLGFFALTMLTVIVLNSANGFYQNSLFGIVGSFPPKYINAIVLGNNICGLLITILLIITTLTFKNEPQWNAAAYFSTALIALIGCIVSVFYLRRNLFYVHQIAVERQASKQRAIYSLTDYVNTFREYWGCLLNVWAVFFVTLFLFPSVLLNIKLYPLSRHNPSNFDSPIPYELYDIVLVFLNFNFFSVVGSKMADFFTWPSPKYLWYPVVLRFLFIPIFYLTNYCPSGYRNFEPLITNEYVVFIIIALMSVSHGYYSSVSMMYAPSGASDPSKARILGKMSAFFLVLGVASGIAFAFLAEYPVHL